MLILNIGMPRSGTLWRYKLIRDLVIAGGGKDGEEIRKKYLLKKFIGSPNANLNTTKLKRLLPAYIPSSLGENYVLFTHARPSDFATKLLNQGKMKAIYGFRDPRDCILSILEYSKRALPQYGNRFLQLKSMEDTIQFMQLYIDIWKEWNELNNALIIKYEDMLNCFPEVVKNIIEYLGLSIPEKQINQIQKLYLPQQKPQQDVKIHFEHGKANRYLKNFTQEEINYMNNFYQDILVKMGYEV